MKPTQNGHIHPVIDASVCIDCKLCQRTCPNNKELAFVRPSVAYAAWSRDETDRESSNSGGVASVLSTLVVNRGGVVYGAAITAPGEVEHMRAETSQDIQKFKRSKYVHSHISPITIHQLKNDVKSGREVMFIGTPCQTAGIRSVIGNAANLYCVDLVCHGIPPQQILKDHLKYVSGGGVTITNFCTRDNEGYYLSVYSDNKLIYRKGFPQDEYLNGFQYALFCRPSCLQCRYSRPERQSDITIGDFWGLKAEGYPHHKVSLILVNTDNGKALTEACRDALFLDERPIEEAVAGNHNLHAPASKHEFYDLFWQLYPKYGYAKAVTISLLKFRVKHAVYKMCMSIPAFKRYYYRSK